MTSTHECPWPGCEVQVPRAMLACRPHWYALPEELRTRLWRAYRGQSGENHFEVVAECLEWYEAREVTA